MIISDLEREKIRQKYEWDGVGLRRRANCINCRWQDVCTDLPEESYCDRWVPDEQES